MNSIRAVGVEMALEHAREGIEIDRFAVGLFARRQQRFELDAGHGIGLRQHGAQLGLLAFLQHAISVDDMEHQRRGGDARVVGAAARTAGLAARKAFDEGDQAIEH